MKVKLQGEPEDLIRRCEDCEHCIFEDILSPQQRMIKVLDRKVPDNHAHRITIEQICGRYYDGVCPMKYAAMRAFCDDRTAMQMGVVKNFVWDLGKTYKKKVDFEQAILNWTKVQDLGRNKQESYAQRYEEIWNRGIREVAIGGKNKKKQIFTADHIYEMIMARPHTYDNLLSLLNALITEHKERDAV
jgi:hypothetical protein